jgi:hypothetical protein
VRLLGGDPSPFSPVAPLTADWVEDLLALTEMEATERLELARRTERDPFAAIAAHFEMEDRW